MSTEDIPLRSNPRRSAPRVTIPRRTLNYRQPMFLFSYGSNNPTQLSERLGRPVTGEPAFMRGWLRAFRGYSQRWGGGVATLIPGRGNTFGYVTEVDDEDLEILDRYEGVASGNYRREFLPVFLENGDILDAVVYLSNSSAKNAPSHAYLVAVAKTIGSFWMGEDGPVKPSDITVRNNPHDSIEANVAEINRLLARMPTEWKAQLDSSRQKLRAAGAPPGELPPLRPDAYGALKALNLNNQGSISSEAGVRAGGDPVPEDVREAAMEGIRLSHRNNYGGYDFIGVARAIQLAISPSISSQAKNRMRMYFDRKTKQDRLSDQYRMKSGRRYWSWLNWGGDPGARWSGSTRFKQTVRSNPGAYWKF